MKKIRKNETAQSGGYYINNAIEGFWGENDEGGDMLEAMGLDRDRLPFSMAFYLKSRSVNGKTPTARLCRCPSESMTRR